jgi:hypothetical protein
MTSGQDDGYLDDDRAEPGKPQSALDPMDRQRAAPLRPGVQSVAGRAWHVRQRQESQPGNQPPVQVLSFQVESEAPGGSPVAVELRSAEISGPIPVDGTLVEVHGRLGRDRLLRATRIRDCATGAVIGAGPQSAAGRVLHALASTAAVAVIAVIVVGCAGVAVIVFQGMRTPGLNPFSGPPAHRTVAPWATGAADPGSPAGPPPRPTVTVSPTSGRRTALLTLTGQGFAAGEAVQIEVSGFQEPGVTADAAGRFVSQFRLAAAVSCPQSQCHIIASGQTSAEWQEAVYTVA